QQVLFVIGAIFPRQRNYASFICETYYSIGAIFPRQRDYASFICNTYFDYFALLDFSITSSIVKLIIWLPHFSQDNEIMQALFVKLTYPIGAIFPRQRDNASFICESYYSIGAIFP
ncbi:11881_t:CDS:1, partial [Racocetra persica]